MAKKTKQKEKTRGLSNREITRQVAAAIKSSKGSKRRSKTPLKKALLIGINFYQNGAHLRGCVNDVNNMASVLKKYCGFGARQIKTLTDKQATTERMKAEIINLFAGALPGDVLYLHYSGHGSNVPDKNGDEDDGWDEILCPTDLDWNNPLLDDWLRIAFKTLPKDVNLTVVLDSCHSGSATRGLWNPHSKDPIPRYMPSPWEIMRSESGLQARGLSRSLSSTLRKKATGGNVKVANMPDVMISGCKDDQTSADAFIKGTYNGALTYNLVQAIKAKKGMLTIRQAHAEALKRVKQGGYSQTPQLAGKKAYLDHDLFTAYV